MLIILLKLYLKKVFLYRQLVSIKPAIQGQLDVAYSLFLVINTINTTVGTPPPFVGKIAKNKHILW